VSSAKKILIVDDDAFIRRPLEFILRAEGFDAVTACDGDECLRAVRDRKPDLIFLDVMMPGQDGFSVCTALKRDPRHADIPVILLSARGQDSDRERGLAVGALDFLTKPYSPSDLVRRVREVLFDSGDHDGTEP
jgi:DNA-binding response OmpR family regulator